MDSNMSSSSLDAGHYLQAGRLSPTPATSRCFIRLVEIPSPESAVALSLTCRAAFGTLFLIAKHKLDESSLTELLRLLEKELSRRFFSCRFCNRLQRFSRSWSPSCPELQCGLEINSFGRLRVNLNHVYLVMISHYFGRGHGLSLS